MNSPKIIVNHRTREEGPYSLPAIEGALKIGRYPAKTPARLEGDRHWSPLDEVVRKARATAMSSGVRTPVPMQAVPRGSEKPADFADSRRKVLITSCIAASVVLVVGLFFLLSNASRSAGKSEQTVSDDDQNVLPSSPEEQPKFSIAKSPKEAERCTVMIRVGTSSGSGSLVLEDGKVFLYTNIHVICGLELTIQDYRGTAIQISRNGEVPSSGPADLVRFQVQDHSGFVLKLAHRGEIEQGGNVITLGDSAGAGVVTSLPGTVTGIGPDRIEVDCPFVPGNSGGPIVNEDGSLLALASYLTANQSIWAKGTRQEIRRFGWIPSAQPSWTPVKRTTLAKESALVDRSVITSRLLAAMYFFPMELDGFKFPSDWPKDNLSPIKQILKESEGHPIYEGILKLNDRLADLERTRSTSNRLTALREYRRFLLYCSSYSKDEITELENLRTPFWLNGVQQRIGIQAEIQDEFRSLANSFARSGELGNALNDFAGQ